MKNKFKTSRTVKKIVDLTNHFAVIFLLFAGIMQNQITAQPITEIGCEPDVKPNFSERPPWTLCEKYGAGTFELTFGITGLENASQVIAAIGSSTFTGNVNIVADFEINQDFTLLGSIVKIEPGVTITVKPGIDFTIDDSKLFACDLLWEGIVLNMGASIETKNGTEIEDAEIAINAPRKSFLRIRNTIFNRNVIGIELGKSFFFGIPVVQQFSGNTFSCNVPLNGTTDGVTYAGVHIINVPATIGAINSQLSTFKEIEYGIRIDNTFTFSTTGVTRCRFENILRDGIYLSQGELDVSFSQFHNCNLRGINLILTRGLTVSGTDFTYDDEIAPNSLGFGNLYYGIYIDQFAQGCEVDISNNDFIADFADTEKDESLRCIGLQGGAVGAGTSITIENNDFDLEFTLVSIFALRGCSAVFANGEFPVQSSMTILWNNIHFERIPPQTNGSAVALVFINGDKNNLYVYGNDFTSGTAGLFEAPNGERGIYLAGSPTGTNNEISANDFPASFNSVFSNNFFSGLFIQDFQNVKYCNNEVRESSYPFYFRGINYGTDYTVNTVVGGGHSFRVENGAIGDQGFLFGEHNGNKWLDKYIGNIHVIPSQHAYCFPPNLSVLSNILTHTPQSVNDPSFPNGYSFFSAYHPAKIDPSTGWFVEDQNGHPSMESCLTMLQEPNPNETDKLIADGGIGGYFTDPVSVWLSERYLYLKLKNHSELVGEFGGFQTFLTNEANSTVGKFYDVSKAVQDAFNAGTEIQVLSQQYAHDSDSLLTTLYMQDSILHASTDLVEIQNALASKENALSGLQMLDSLVFALQSDYESEVVAALQGAIQLNSQISTAQSFESDEKTVNDIFLNAVVFQDGILTEAQVSQLQAIGMKCPRADGPAVYRARGMLPQCADFSWDDDYDTCYPEPGVIFEEYYEPGGQAMIANPNGNATIFPNPSARSFTVRVGLENPGAITISNSVGQVLQTVPFDGSSSTLEISLDLSPGIYHCTLRYEDGTLHSERLIIVK